MEKSGFASQSRPALRNEPTLQTLAEITGILDKALQGRYVIIGGQAVRLWTNDQEGRSTDIDILVKGIITDDECRLLRRNGLELTVDEHFKRGLIYHPGSSSRFVKIDINYLPADFEVPMELILERAVQKPVGAASLPVADLETLVLLKTIAGREKDWDDIRRLRRGFAQASS